MSDETNNLDEASRRLKIAELQVERSKAVMESLAGFCHVIMASMELLKMDEVDNETKKQVVDMCLEAVTEIKSLLAEMKKKREYVAEAYLAGNAAAGNMISLPEWADKAPPKASWDK